MSKENMKDQIDVSVRRSPKYAVFMGVGAIIGVLAAGLLTLIVDPASVPAEYTVAKGAGLLLLVLGVGGLFLGGLVALVLDWVGRRRSREYRVDAQIDVVDDPKAIAAQRIAEMKGTPAEADAAPPAEADDAPPAEAEAASPTEDTGTAGPAKPAPDA